MLVTADDTRRTRGRRGSAPLRALISAPLLLAALASCEGSGLIEPETERSDLLTGPSVPGPGADEYVVTITDVRGATGLDGSFAVDDFVEVSFVVTDRAGEAVSLDLFDRGTIMLSGPTHNYQPVLVPTDDLLVRAALAAEGYTYRFDATIPSVYPAPFNNTRTFFSPDGELQWRPLQSGTYTVGIDLSRHIRGGVETGSATRDVAFLGAESIDSREVAKVESCNRCHGRLEAHGGTRRDLHICVLCHTSGAEDLNDPAHLGGSPALTIDMRVLIHRIHNGAHLPSALGMHANPDGTLRYDLEKKPYEVVRSDGQISDYSNVSYPLGPAASSPLPRDLGYSALPPSAQAIEDQVRRGASDCTSCHGDPDGDGPIEPPAQGGIIYSQPTRRACGACHDDVEFAWPYTSNGVTMPPIHDDVECIECHMPRASDFGGPLTDDAVLVAISTEDAHKHPLSDTATNTGLVATLTEAKVLGADAFGPGAGLEVALTIVDGAGQPIPEAEFEGVTLVLTGPDDNPQHLGTWHLSGEELGAGTPYRVTLPETVELEFVGRSTGAGDVFETARTPRSGSLQVATRGPSEVETVLHTDSAARATTLAVSDSDSIARDDILVIDDGLASQEFVRVTYVEARRIAFVPPLRQSHLAGASVATVSVVPKAEGTDYTFDDATGAITATTDFGADAEVLISYVTDYEVPALYPAPPNDSDLLGETIGEWSGAPVVSGTYRLGVMALRQITVEGVGEPTPYPVPSVASVQTLTYGEATEGSPHDIGGSCETCHGTVVAHGGRYAGVEACRLCHGAAGIEDRSRTVAANAPATPGRSVGLAPLLHGVHLGALTVVGYGHAPYPDNYRVTEFSTAYPAAQGRECVSCHAADDAPWRAPRDRSYPDAGGETVTRWRPLCSGCHTSSAAALHMDGPHACQAPEGEPEPCASCHLSGSIGVATLHGGAMTPESNDAPCDGDGTAPTYDGTVKQILQDKCAPCHSTTLACGTHTSLADYDATQAPMPEDPSRKVFEVSADRAEGLGGGLMPPPRFGIMSHDEVAALRSWADAGAPRCD